jgi:replication-associated recombination protein RarA
VSAAIKRHAIPVGCPARLNPLAVARTDSLPFQFAESSWESELKRLRILRFRAAIVGPKGSGKTTLLEQLHSRLVNLGHHCLFRRVPVSTTEQAALLVEAERSPRDSILLLDSAEQLSRSNRRALLKKAFHLDWGLVVTTHRPEFLPTWIKCRTNLKLLHSLLVQLLPADNSAWQAPANEAFRKHQGNIREVFRELYDLYASGELA